MPSATNPAEEFTLLCEEPVPYSAADHNAAVSLMCRAMLLGDAESVWDEALAGFRTERALRQEDGTWAAVCDQYQRFHTKPPPLPEISAGSMNDSSKRQRSVEGYGEKGSTRTSAASPRTPGRNLRGDGSAGSTMEPTRRGSVKAVAPAGPPPPFPVGRVVGMPNDVNTMEEWGRTMIRFGKFASRGWTYADLVAEDSDETRSYIAWSMPRVKSGGDQLRDLAQYLIARKDQGNLTGFRSVSPSGSSTSSYWRRTLRTP